MNGRCRRLPVKRRRLELAHVFRTRIMCACVCAAERVERWLFVLRAQLGTNPGRSDEEDGGGVN